MTSLLRNTCLLVIVVSLVLGAASSCGSSKGGAPTSPGPGPGTVSELSSGNIGAGGAFSHRFTTAGTYAYHCIFHSPMHGTVVVSASAPDSVANVNIQSSTSPFPGASVRPGGTVTWTNGTGVIHTVTSD